MGKQSMLDGGVGCIRLKPIVVEGRVHMLMSATSSDEAQRGIPVAVSEERFLGLSDRIEIDGTIVCDLQGRLAAVPPDLVGLFDCPGCPRLYLHVEDMQIREDLPPPGKPQVSVAVSFTSRVMQNLSSQARDVR